MVIPVLELYFSDNTNGKTNDMLVVIIIPMMRNVIAVT